LYFEPDNTVNLTENYTKTYNCINGPELYPQDCPGDDCDCGCGTNINCLFEFNQKRDISHSGTIYYLLKRALDYYRPDDSTEIPVRGALFVESDVTFSGDTCEGGRILLK
jgi:hypothetical protein